MLSHYENSPRQIKESELARINGELQRGTYDPMPELRSRIERDARHYRRNMISTGLTTGFLGAIGLGTMFSLTPMLIGAIAGGCFVLFSAKGVAVYSQTKKALHKDDIGDYLNDDELDDLDHFQQTFKPSTEQAKQTQLMIKALCDELLEEEDVDGKEKAVDVEAEEIKEGENGAADGAIKTPNNPVEKPPLDTENFVKPTVWMDTPGPKPTTDSLGGSIKNTKVDDVQLERLNRLEEKAADDFVFLAKDITNLKDELKAAQKERHEFEKKVLAVIETNNNKNAETFKTRNARETAETIGIPTVSEIETVSQKENDFSLETTVHPEKSSIIVGDFDPEKKEKPDEYGTFLSLVLTEEYKPKGAPIIERMWKIQPGGSKRYKAAVVRRDQFAERMKEFGLYGD